MAAVAEARPETACFKKRKLAKFTAEYRWVYGKFIANVS